jgi:hypothetical protein
MDKPSFTHRMLLNSGMDTPTAICSCAKVGLQKAIQMTQYVILRTAIFNFENTMFAFL